MRYLDFEWSDAKASQNVRKHEVDFREAASVFRDMWSITINDTEHSEYEDREKTVGISSRGRLLTVVHVQRGEFIRIISARPASETEAADYAQS